MPIQFVNFSKEDFLSKKVLHRYMPLEYALKMLNEKALWFASPQSWKDPFEKRFISAEALVRLEDERYGNIEPTIFLKYAELTNQIHVIGNFVIEEVFKFFENRKKCVVYRR